MPDVRQIARERLSRERGYTIKEWGGRIPIAIVYPNSYYIGMSNLGIATVQNMSQAVETLSGGQRQAVAVARAATFATKFVVLDEPTAALGVAQTAQVLELVRQLADNGLAVVLISHNMNDVFAVADRIAALYLGRMAAQVKASDITHSQIVELITAGRSGDIGLAPAHASTAADIDLDEVD